MRLAIVSDNLTRTDGQGRVNYEIANHALAAGHEVTILACRVDPQLIERGGKWVPIKPLISKPYLFKGIGFARQAGRWLSNHAAELDVTLGNGYTMTCPHDVSISNFVHGTWIKSPLHVARMTRGPYAWYQWLYTRFHWIAELKSYRQAKWVVAVSKLIRGELLEIGIPDSSIRVIENGVDLDEFRPGPEEREPLRQAMGFGPEATVALFVGDIRTPRKGLDTVLRALVDVPDLHLAVIGKVASSPYPALAEELGVAGRVHFLGFRSDVAKIMRGVDFFVFPSRYDTFGLVILEAMASGLPVVTAATAGAASLITPDAGIVLKDPNDVRSLAAAMQSLTADASQRARFGAAARQIAELHSWKEMADKYLGLFAECVTARSARTPASR